MIEINATPVCNLNDITEEEWLEIRRNYIGASDIGAIAGLNPWMSAITVYLSKVHGHYEDLSDNEHVEFGKQMEGPIREWFEQRFLKAEKIPIKVSQYPIMLRHPQEKIFACNLDAVVEHPELGLGVVEIKTASERQWREWEEDNIPDMYYAQVQQQLFVTGLPYAYIVALVGKKLLWKYVPRNEDNIEALVAIGNRFWNEHVIPKVTPDPEGIADARKALLTLYGKEEAGEVKELHHLQSTYDQYKELSKLHKELGQDLEAIKQRFMAELGTAELGFIGSKKVTFKTIYRKEYTVAAGSSRQLRVY